MTSHHPQAPHPSQSSAPVTEPAAAPRMPSLSPSRAADFKTCPLLFRFRTIDRLPERPSADQARGTLVHAVLEQLFDLPPEERTPAGAQALVEGQWLRLVEEQPELADLFEPAQLEPVLVPAARTPLDGAGSAQAGTGADADPVPVAVVGSDGASALSPEEFLDSARRLLTGYFSVEDPRRLQPAERETLVEAVVDDQLLLRGYIDRLDVSPAGDLRVVDYKTGGAPREAFEARALFQLKFYALVLWRTRGTLPRVLRLVYLKDAEVCDFSPDADELDRFQKTLVALWSAIERAKVARDFRPKPSKLCGWCAHQALCPTFGGTPPPYPEPAQAAGPATGPVPAARSADIDELPGVPG